MIHDSTGWFLVILDQYEAVRVDTWWYWVRIEWYWLVLSGTWSVEGRTGSYLVVLGQYMAILLGSW